MADVALVGFPSAGKSSLIAAMSAARPKIADYPFTTLHPNLGVVEAGSSRYTVADVPGLIEGASEGKGLGLEFLRHVERCAALLHVIDCATLEPGRDPLTDLDVILGELAAYPVPDGQVPLLDRPQLIALNKIDVPDAHDLAEMVKPISRSVATACSRSRPRAGRVARAVVRARRYREADRVAKIAAAATSRASSCGRRAVDEKDFTIRVEGGTYGDPPHPRHQAERWMHLTDFTNEEAVGYLADRLARSASKRRCSPGAVPGSAVVIGEGDSRVFDWEPTLTSAAELITSPRGTDARFDDNRRRTSAGRREEYKERMDAKAAARAELEAEREAGVWDADSEVRESE